MCESPFSEADVYASGKKILQLLWKTEVHCSVYLNKYLIKRQIT